MSSPLFLFAGGGTGGHLFPGIAVAEALRERSPGAEFLFCGSSRATEQSILRENGFESVALKVPPIASLKRHPFRFLNGHWQDWRTARAVLDDRKPAAVIGLGGLASFAMCEAAGRKNVPVVLLEQNVTPGRATRCLSKRFPVCTSFEATRQHLPAAWKLIHTGNPLRKEILELNSPESDEFTDKGTILILGGSQGSRTVNEAVIESARRLSVGENDRILEGWSIIHQTGEDGVDTASSAWNDLGVDALVEPFFNDLPRQYTRASLVIGRSGATTLAEIAALGLPSILLPYELARDDHQRANARVFADAGAAALLDSRDGNLAESLATILVDILEKPERRAAMSQAARKLAHSDAAQKVAVLIEEQMTRHG